MRSRDCLLYRGIFYRDDIFTASGQFIHDGHKRIQTYGNFVRLGLGAHLGVCLPNRKAWRKYRRDYFRRMAAIA